MLHNTNETKPEWHTNNKHKTKWKKRKKKNSLHGKQVAASTVNTKLKLLLIPLHKLTHFTFCPLDFVWLCVSEFRAVYVSSQTCTYAEIVWCINRKTVYYRFPYTYLLVVQSCSWAHDFVFTMDFLLGFIFHIVQCLWRLNVPTHRRMCAFACIVGVYCFVNECEWIGEIRKR